MPRPGRAFLAVAAVAAVYVAWLGAHWLRLPYSSLEIAVCVARLADFQAELARTGHVPFWTATFMSGSSKALPYAGDLPLVPWALLAPVVGTLAAGRIVALASIALGGVGMFLCARRFVRGDLAAACAALAYLSSPMLLSEAAGSEHIGVVVFAGLLPIAWLAFARVLDDGRPARVAACAIVFALLVWAQNKQTAVQLPFLGAYAVFATRRSGRWKATLRALAVLGVLMAALTAFIVVPVLSEVKLIKLFEGDPFDGWQRVYAVSSVGALVHRDAAERDYLGVALLAVVLASVLFARRRADAGAFWLLAVFVAAAVALGHGPRSVASAAARALSQDDEESASFGAVVGLGAAALVIFGLVAWRLETARARIPVLGAIAAIVFVPWFRVLEAFPLYRDIRAPEVFFQIPGVFFASILAGFFVSDVVEPRFGDAPGPWPLRVVATLAALFVVDAWPFQAPMKASDVAASTVDAARTLYAALGEEAKVTPGKVYVITSRCIHDLGPSWGGPPVASEPALEYMAPRGTGRLAVAAGQSFALRRAYFDLVGVRWVVFDKSDPYAATSGVLSQLDVYRKLFPLDREDDDFAVFRVPTAHAFVSGYAHRALAFGDPHRLPELAMALEGEGYLLEHADGERVEDATPEHVARYAAVYAPSLPDAPADVLKKLVVLHEDQPRFPPRVEREDSLADIIVERPSAEEIRARFTATSDSVAVVAESYYPYWRATLDGRPAKLLRVAYGLMGVDVAAGGHELVLRYEPPRTYAWSAILSAVTLLGCVGVAVRRRV
jgi:hypothetical protein